MSLISVVKIQAPSALVGVKPARSWLRALAPTTMAGLVAAGCLLAAVPLLAALLLAGSQLDRITRLGEQTVQEGLEVTRLGSQLRDNVNDLERSLRQYIALGDPALRVLVERRLAQTQATLDQLDTRGLVPLAGPAAEVRRGLAAIADQWRQGPQPAALSIAAERGHALGAQVDALLAAGGAEVGAEVKRMDQARLRVRRLMLLSTLALIPVTTLLAFAISTAVTRPLRQLINAINELGHGRYGSRVEVGFPKEMHRLGDQLDWLRRRLNQLEADKERFLRHVSHELKTPLASLSEGAALLHDGSLGFLNRRQREVSKILVEAGAELRGMIDALLAYAEWRNELRREERAWFDAQALIEEILARHALAVDGRELRVELALGNGRLFGRRAQLRIALDNLFSNAIKHAPPQSAIEISCAIHDDRCELAVRDHGPGVPEQEQQNIFEPFVRGDDSEVAGIPGSGLGLSIVREIMHVHHGTAEVANAAPGARFTLCWPCPPCGPGPAAGDA